MSDGVLRMVISGLLALALGFALNTTRLILMANAELRPEMGIGNAWGQDWGPAAEKDCPKSPFDGAVRSDEQMQRPQPPWGRDGPLAHEYWGETQMSTEPNMAMCQWSAEYWNKRDVMLDRCWPLWHGRRNGASDKKHTCRSM